MLGEQTQSIPTNPSAEANTRFVSQTEPAHTPELVSQRASVARWQRRIDSAKRKWKGDFQRMQNNMDFVAGLQWPDQNKVDWDQYVVNLTLRTINQRVAVLYARNPRISAQRRPRMDFQLWDGNVETLMQAVVAAQQMQSMGIPVPPDMMALFADYQNGQQHRKIVEKVGKTLETVYHYQQDTQEPNFKTQMKQLVRRVAVCGVAYIKVSYSRYFDHELTQSETRVSLSDRILQARRIIDRLQEHEITEDSADMETLRSLIGSLNVSPDDPEKFSVNERLIFDFPKATSIIPDENCSILRGFVGADWIAEEFHPTLEFVNAFFEKDIKSTATDLKLYNPTGQSVENYSPMTNETTDRNEDKTRVTLWKIYDRVTKSTLTIVDGYKDYVEAPAPMDVSTKGFWQIVPVTFNDIEVTEGCKTTIFPPSDVDLLKSPQKEINRCREALRRHRKANRPRYVYPEGTLLQEDLDKIYAADDQELVPLKGLTPGTEPGKVLQPLETQSINPLMYQTEPLQQDVLLASGQQEANLGPAQSNVTATVGTIAEQSRITVATSDIDSLDDSLSDVAEIGGEMLLKEMSVETVKRIAGPGAVWPGDDRSEFLNEIQLQVVAASSGRPNKAVEVANWQQVAPLILQAAQLPPQAQPTMQAVIRETVKRIDDRLEPADFFPLPVPNVPEAAIQARQQVSTSGPTTTVQPTTAQPPMVAGMISNGGTQNL